MVAWMLPSDMFGVLTAGTVTDGRGGAGDHRRGMCRVAFVRPRIRRDLLHAAVLTWEARANGRLTTPEAAPLRHARPLTPAVPLGEKPLLDRLVGALPLFRDVYTPTEPVESFPLGTKGEISMNRAERACLQRLIPLVNVCFYVYLNGFVSILE